MRRRRSRHALHAFARVTDPPCRRTTALHRRWRNLTGRLRWPVPPATRPLSAGRPWCRSAACRRGGTCRCSWGRNRARLGRGHKGDARTSAREGRAAHKSPREIARIAAALRYQTSATASMKSTNVTASSLAAGNRLRCSPSTRSGDRTPAFVGLDACVFARCHWRLSLARAHRQESSHYRLVDFASQTRPELRSGLA